MIDPHQIRPNRPRWTFALPYPGRMPKLSYHQWNVLGLLSVAGMFDAYDVGIMGLAISEIQTSLAIAERDVGGLMAVIRLGMLPAFALTVMADRLGRRRLLLATIIGFTACTFLTAFARDAQEFMLLQFIGRIFIAGESMLAIVVIVEELNARDRGFGIGLLGALGSFGHGLSSMIFPLTDLMPYGWRSLYVIGAIPLLFLAWFRRGLNETRRFESSLEERDQETGLAAALRPVLSLVRMYPGRLLAMCATIVPFSFVVVTAMSFHAKTLLEVHEYEKWQVTVLFMLGGGLGIMGNIAGGALGDRLGRKRVMSAAMALFALAVFTFYNVTGALVPIAWITLLFTLTASEALLTALGAELFPTSYRSTASGMRAIVGTLAGSVGLALEGSLYAWAGSHAAAITVMTPALLLPPLVIWLFLPETAKRELEELSPELSSADG